jgi:hypothetical protein
MWHQRNHRDCKGNGIDYITLATILWEWRELVRRIYSDNKEQYTSSHTGINIRAGRLLISSWSSFGFLHRVADECASTSGECIASVFRVTDSDSRECWSMLGRKKYITYTGKIEEIWTIRDVGERETEKYMECLVGQISSNFPTKSPTYFSIQGNQNHSLRRWKQYLPKRRKTRLRPSTDPVALPGIYQMWYVTVRDNNY